MKCSRPDFRLVTLFLSLDNQKLLNQRSSINLRLHKGRPNSFPYVFLKSRDEIYQKLDKTV